MRRIIFLDIDGVLNHNDTVDRIGCYLGLDPALIPNLNRITDAHPTAEIVVSSTWRSSYVTGVYTDFTGLKALLKKRGVTGKVIDCTPTFFGNRGRGYEISTWLEGNAIGPNDTYVILDDLASAHKIGSKIDHTLETHHIQTSEFEGLTEKDAELAIMVLDGLEIRTETQEEKQWKLAGRLQVFDPVLE